MSQILKMFDYFGIEFYFNYKSHQKYQSSCGGLIFIIYFLLNLIYAIISFISFYKRENVNNITFLKRLSGTDIINFNEKKMNFAIGLELNDYNAGDIKNKTLDDIINSFFIKVNHLHHIKDGGRKKN